MDLENLRLFMKVVEVGSIQGAAHSMGVSRSSLRLRLDNLEAEVGSRLYVPSPAGITLTHAGRVVLEEGRDLLERYARLVAAAKADNAGPVGKLRMLLPIGMPELAGIGLIRGLNAVAPGLCVEESQYDDPPAHIHDPFDLMFYFGDPPESGQWFSQVLHRHRLVPLASEAYLEEHGKPQSAADLARHRLIAWRVGKWDPMEWPLHSGGSLRIRPVFCSPNAQLVHHAAQEGLGILLGSSDPTLLPTPTPLLPVLEDVIGRELVFRCLSPVPSSAHPSSRAVLKNIQDFVSSIAADE